MCVIAFQPGFSDSGPGACQPVKRWRPTTDDIASVALAGSQPVPKARLSNAIPCLFACSPGQGTELQEMHRGKHVLAADIQLGIYPISHPFVEINPVFHVANFGAIPLQHLSVTFDKMDNLAGC
jgi:hypothetical protein